MNVEDSSSLGPDEIVARARELLENNNPPEAYRLIEKFLEDHPPPAPRGLFLVRGLIGLRFNKPAVGLHGFEAELFQYPDNHEAREQLDALCARMYPTGPTRPAARGWETVLNSESISNFEKSSWRHTYHGMPMVKNCFDLAIYPLLLAQVRPATIIEIGTLYGASAAWMSDLTRALSLQTQIYSVDTSGMPLSRPQRVTFIRGNGRLLEKTFPAEFLADLPRPLLVIEDADHSYETTTAVLNFFHPVLRPGEYIIVEDAMSASGPVQALRQWFATHGEEYEVDAKWCDFFGINVTWCVNGYLRKR